MAEIIEGVVLAREIEGGNQRPPAPPPLYLGDIQNAAGLSPPAVLFLTVSVVVVYWMLRRV